MKKKRIFNFSMAIIAVILFAALVKLFDFQQLRFEKVGLAVVYLIALLIAVYAALRNPGK